jgi:ATP-dependent Lhr-like helicase
VELWREGYVEPIKPPDVPYHLFAQQVLALLLQQGAIPENRILSALAGLVTSACLNEAACADIIQHMLEMCLLASDSGLLMVGDQAERLYGAKHYITLLSIFDSPPLFTVFWETKEIGAVHPISFLTDMRGGPVVLSLAGRSWQVSHIDWEHQTAQVTPADEFGKSRWLGESRPLSNRLCQAVRTVLLDSDAPSWWSKRAKDQIASARENAPAVAPDATVVEIDPDRARVTWWTFAGLNANFELAASWPGTVRFDNFSVTLEGRIPVASVQKWIRGGLPIDPVHFDKLPRPKFHECLPSEVVAEMLRARTRDLPSVEKARSGHVVYRDVD